MGTKLPSTKRVFSLKSILLLFLGLLGLVGLLVLSLPLWLGLAIRTFAPEDLAQFDSYKMEGYGHFRLEGVSVTLPQANVFIDELHGLTPLNWYSKSRKDSQEDFLQIKHLEVILFPNDATEDNSPESSSLPKNLPDALKLLEGLLQLTDTWLPQATIEHATITQDTRILELSDLRWKNRSLNFQGKLNGFPQHPFKTLVTLPSEGPSLEFVVPNADFEIKTSLVENNRDWVISAIILFRENTALLESTFGPSTWLPESATWNLENWELDLQSLGVDSPYPQLSFNLLGGWKEGVIDNSLDGHLSPPTQTSDSLVPPVDFKSQIGGDAESLTVSRFSLEAPGISASMTDPVEYRLKEMQMAGELNFDIDLDLGMLNREELQGQLTGFLNVTTSEGKPSGEFTLQGKAVKIKTHEFEDLNIQAELAWPNLRIEAITARLTSGTTLDLSGLIDLVARQVTQASLSGQIMQKTVAEYLPEDLLLDNISFNTSASGPYNAINHDGSLTIDTIEMDALNPFSTNLTWKGQMMNLEQVEIAASAEAAEIKLDGSGTLSSEQMQWQINALQLATNGQPLAQLAESTIVTIIPGKPTAVSFDSMKLSGPGGNVTATGMVAYPNKAQLSIEVDTLETSSWIDPWLKKPPAPIQIESISAKAHWDQGPAQIELHFNTTLLQNERLIHVAGKLSSNGENTHFDNIEISDAQGPWITTSGVAPISFHPGETEFLHISTDDSINLKFATTESQNWLDWLSSISPVPLKTFNSEIQLEGSLRDLAGNFELELVTKAAAEKHGMPSTTIASKGTIKNSSLFISDMSVSVAEETFKVSGQLDLPNAVIERIEDPSTEIDWGETTFNLKIPPSKLTPLRYFAPQLLSTGGEIEADLNGSIKTGIAGFFKIKGVNTRAIFPFGSLREISADLAFKQSQATFRNISAHIGREPVTISGSLDYRDWKAPTYHFNILGKNLPLVRKPGLLLRSNLNLAIDKTADQETRVTGTVTLKDGLFLLNRNILLAGGSAGGRSASTRPPFFSVEVPPTV